MKAKITQIIAGKEETKDVDLDAGELGALSLTPGYIVRVPTMDQAPLGLVFVAPDEDGFRRVGPDRRIVLPTAAMRP